MYLVCVCVSLCGCACGPEGAPSGAVPCEVEGGAQALTLLVCSAVDGSGFVSDLAAPNRRVEDTALWARLSELEAYQSTTPAERQRVWRYVAFAVVVMASRCCPLLLRAALTFPAGEGGRQSLTSVVCDFVGAEGERRHRARDLLQGLLQHATNIDVDDGKDDAEEADDDAPAATGSPPARRQRVEGPLPDAPPLPFPQAPLPFPHETRRMRRRMGILLEVLVNAIFYGTIGWGEDDARERGWLRTSERALQIGVDAVLAAAQAKSKDMHDRGPTKGDPNREQGDKKGYIVPDTGMLVAAIDAVKRLARELRREKWSLIRARVWYFLNTARQRIPRNVDGVIEVNGWRYGLDYCRGLANDGTRNQKEKDCQARLEELALKKPGTDEYLHDAPEILRGLHGFIVMYIQPTTVETFLVLRAPAELVDAG